MGTVGVLRFHCRLCAEDIYPGVLENPLHFDVDAVCQIMWVAYDTEKLQS